MAPYSTAVSDGGHDVSAARAAAPIREVDLDWRSVVVLLGFFVGLVALRAMVHSTPRTLTWLALAGLLALALNPLVVAIQRRTHVRRSVAVALVVTSVIGLLAIAIALLAPPAIRQARRLSSDVPRVTRQLGELPLIGPRLRENHVPEKARQWVEELPHRLARDPRGIGKAGKRLAGGAASAIVTVLLAVTLLLDGERLVRNVRRLVPPPRQVRVDRVGRLAYSVVGRYVAGSLVVAVIAGTAVLIVGLILGVPLSPLLGVWVALFDLVPQIGGAVGGIPFVFLGFTQSAQTGVICAVFFVLYLQFENHILSPLVVGKAVSLSPPATMIAALIGVSVAGVVGGLLAVPFVGAAKAVYLELRPEAAPGPASAAPR
jgi:predicted PurR-regulated permease PerM